jgi:hypothetical protein
LSDIRASPRGITATTQYGIRRGKDNKTTVCFDGQGSFLTVSGETACSGNYRYRLYVYIKRNSLGTSYLPDYAYVRVTWPAAAAPTVTPSGSVEAVAAFFEK